MMVKVAVVFYLLSGGSVEVEREKDQPFLNDEVCYMMAIDVGNELLGATPPRIMADAIKDVGYDCWWVI